MKQIRVRPADQSDFAELVRILNHYVTETHFTFDTRPFTLDQRRGWLESFSSSGRYRLLVAEVAGQLVGYASSAKFRPKPAYDQSVETTIYLDPAFTGQGIGWQLYRSLLDSIRSEGGLHRAYGVIALPNEGSIALHKRLGFRLVGTLREVGFKFGRYWDTSWYEKDLSDPGGV